MCVDFDKLKLDQAMICKASVWFTADPELWSAAVSFLKINRKYYMQNWKLPSKEGFFREVSDTLKWKEQFGTDRWNGNLDAFNDGLSGLYSLGRKRILISIADVDRLHDWYGERCAHIWDMLQAVGQDLQDDGVDFLVLANTRSAKRAGQWGSVSGTSQMERGKHPGLEIARYGGLLDG